MKKLNKKILVWSITFLAVTPAVYIYATGMTQHYMRLKFSRVHECVFGLYRLMPDFVSCSEISKFILIRDTIFFLLYPLILIAFAILVGISLKKYAES